MGGCCCCCFSSRRSEPIGAQTYYYDPRASEERRPLSVTSPRLVVDTNLDASVPDMRTPPPVRAKNGVVAGTASATGSVMEPSGVVPIGSLGKEPKDIDGGTHLEMVLSKDVEDDIKKPCESFVTTIEEDDCPICLEEYSEENPKMITGCDHHFHLCCILEWMERSENCPVCDKVVNIDEALDS